MIDIYTKSSCAYCVRAKKLLSSRGIPFNEYHLDVHFGRGFIQETFPTMRTFPIIIKDGVVLGGYDALVERITEDENFGLTLIKE